MCTFMEMLFKSHCTVYNDNSIQFIGIHGLSATVQMHKTVCCCILLMVLNGVKIELKLIGSPLKIT